MWLLRCLLLVVAPPIFDDIVGVLGVRYFVTLSSNKIRGGVMEGAKGRDSKNNYTTSRALEDQKSFSMIVIDRKTRTNFHAIGILCQRRIQCRAVI